MKKEYSDWLQELYKIQSNCGSKDIDLLCPSCGSVEMDYQYVGHKIDRIGFLLFWCYRCEKGIRISRIDIPVGVDFLDFESNDTEVFDRIPKFEELSP